MEAIEQAVFTSARGDRACGYRVAGTSAGAAEADLRAVAAWAPSHDSLLAEGPTAASVNFHPLPGGRHCVSRTVAAGVEYSGRGGQRVYTQCLLVSGKVLARFANNPFALLLAAAANGSLRTFAEVPATLPAISLPGRASPVDERLLARLVLQVGCERLAALVEAALASPRLAVAGCPSPELLVAGLVNCLPPARRTEFSFSTGLRASPRRPYRLLAAPAEAAARKRLAREGVAIFSLDDPVPTAAVQTESALRVRQALAAGRYDALSGPSPAATSR